MWFVTLPRCIRVKHAAPLKACLQQSCARVLAELLLNSGGYRIASVADAVPLEAAGLDGVDAESSWMDDVAEAERDYVPTALSDRAFVETSEFPIEPFSLNEEREVRSPLCCRSCQTRADQALMHNGAHCLIMMLLVQNGFYDEDGNYTTRAITVDYRDAWLESLPADMGNVNVSERDQAALNSCGPPQQVEEQVGNRAQTPKLLPPLVP